jgi:SAM-dependent methyltransferase
MLDLLRERGIAYFGVDPDDAMIARCVEKGHVDVEVVGAIEHLASVPDEHYGAIFCAQVIEHLPHDELGEMLALAVRKLRPDGVFIAETVNPHAPHALRAFWTDLTHQHPIFPEVALSLCELAGFGSAYVFHPTGTGSNDVDSWTQSAYAVVARLRPSSANDG